MKLTSHSYRWLHLSQPLYHLQCPFAANGTAVEIPETSGIPRFKNRDIKIELFRIVFHSEFGKGKRNTAA